MIEKPIVGGSSEYMKNVLKIVAVVVGILSFWPALALVISWLMYWVGRLMPPGGGIQ